MAGRFSVEAVFKAVDRITAPVSRMQNRVGKFTRGMSRGFTKLNRVVKKFASGLKKGAAVAGASLVAVGALMLNIIPSGADFGRAIGSAAAKFPDKIKRGTKEFKALEEAARRVGATTEFTATQAAQGLNFLAKAGFSANFSIKSLSKIVDFATASEIEFSEAADIASDTLGAFGLDSANAAIKMKGLQRVMDVMSLTANSTNVSVAELFESIKLGGPIAAASGVSIETFSATMGFLANSGIKATKAGTAAKNITLALAGVGNKAAKTFKTLGISLADSNGELRDQFDVMDDLRRKIGGFGQKQRITIMESIFGKISLAAASKLLSDSTANVRKLRNELNAAGGSSKRTAAFIRNDVKGSIDGLTSSIEGVKISIFSLNEGPLKKAIDQMTDWVRVNEKVIASGIGEFLLSLVENFQNIITWVKRIAIGIGVFIAFSAILKTLIGVMTLVNLVMAANPITIMILSVIALIAALSALVVWVNNIQNAFSAAKTEGDEFDDDFDDDFNDDRESMVSPQARVARSIEEQRTTSTAEVTIKDDTGRAEVTGGKFGNGITLQPSGAF